MLIRNKETTSWGPSKGWRGGLEGCTKEQGGLWDFLYLSALEGGPQKLMSPTHPLQCPNGSAQVGLGVELRVSDVCSP